MPRQLVQQAVRLGFPHVEVLQELQGQTSFVERQPQHVHEVGDLDDDLHTEFTTAQHAGDPAVLILGAAIDCISDQNGPAISKRQTGRVGES
jgi:hypothetical protein